MGCTVSVSLISEHVDGDIGDDWQYAIEARVSGQSGAQSGRIEVEMHKIKSGVTQEVPDGHSADIPAGPCGSLAELELHLQAAEYDWIMSDIGEQTTKIQIQCPDAGAPPTIIEREVAVKVKETPLVLGGSATLILRVRVSATCEQSG